MFFFLNIQISKGVSSLTENLLRREPPRNVLAKHPPEQVLGRLWDWAEGPHWKSQVGPQDSFEYLHRRLPIKGREPSEHHVEDDTSAPHVHLLPVGPASHHLRSHVVGRAHQAGELAWPLPSREQGGGSEIGELEEAAGVEEYVVGLDVAVGHPVAVAVRNRMHELGEEWGRLWLRDRPAGFHEELVEVRGVAELQDHMEVCVILEHIVNLQKKELNKQKLPNQKREKLSS